MKKKIKIIIVFIVMIALMVTVYFSLLKGDNASIEVSSMNAYKGSISKNLDLTGVLYSIDSEEISITPNLKVLKTYVEENSLVEEGQLLAELDSTDLLISLEKSQISLEQLNSDLTDLKVSNSEVVILKNTLLIRQEEYNKIKNNLDSAVDNLEKGKTLYQEGAISETEYDKYITSENDLRSSLKIAELNYNDANTNYNDFNSNNKNSIESLERQIKSMSLDIDRLNNEIEKNKIYSSINGIVTEFPLKESRETTANSKVIIYDTSSYEFVAKVTQDDAVFIREGQNAKVKINGMSNYYDGFVSQVGKIAEIDEVSGSKTPKVEVKINVDNSNNMLKSGYEGEAVLEVDNMDNVVIVKNECIKKDDENNQYLYVLENGNAKKTFVETGLSDGYNVVVTSGIDENDYVIINPPIDLNDGMTVKISK